jgi:hypothetical protein
MEKSETYILVARLKTKYPDTKILIKKLKETFLEDNMDDFIEISQILLNRIKRLKRD